MGTIFGRKMKVAKILEKMIKHRCLECNRIHIETIKGRPHSREGGEWVDIGWEEFKEVLARIELKDLDINKSGWKDILNKWKDEGKLAQEDIN